MPHTFRIDGEAGLLTEAFTGLLDAEMLANINAAIRAHPAFRAKLDFLTDLRGVEFSSSFGFREMWEHARILPGLRVARQAFVVQSEVAYGMARMFIALAESTGEYEDIRIFTTIEEAMRWLKS